MAAAFQPLPLVEPSSRVGAENLVRKVATDEAGRGARVIWLSDSGKEQETDVVERESSQDHQVRRLHLLLAGRIVVGDAADTPALTSDAKDVGVLADLQTS